MHGQGGQRAWSLWTAPSASRGGARPGPAIEAPPGRTIVAHLRARDSLVQTPLCRRGRWVFAYDGTIEDPGYLRDHTSAERRASHDDSDGQRLLAFLLTRLDAAGVTDAPADDTTDAVVAVAAAEVAGRIGSLSFVASDGEALYALRFDRALHVLLRPPQGNAPATFLAASEPPTAEDWSPLDDRTLVRCRPGRSLGRPLDVRFLLGRDPRPARASESELPFTD